MAFALSANQNQKRTIQKKQSIGGFFKNKKRKWLAGGLVAVVALAGAYFLFFVGAAPNNCSPVEGGGICDVNQASSPDGTDAVLNTNDEILQLSTNGGWTDWGVPFRAPNFPQNGAVPVWRFFNASITMHFVALEGSDTYNQVMADASNVREGIVFYAWPDGRQPGTTPIHRINRKPLWFMQMYTDNQNTVNWFAAQPDGSYSDGGVNFWAYPGNYFPPAPAAPAKDTDCANQNLKIGDKGACVQWHKGVLNGYIAYNGATATPLDVNNNEFDATTNDYTKVFVASLQSKGVKVANYSNVVTAEIWNAFATGYPVVPAAPAPVPPRPSTGVVSTTPTAPKTEAPKDASNTNTLTPTTTSVGGTENKSPSAPAVPNRNPDTNGASGSNSTTPAVPNRNPDKNGASSGAAKEEKNPEPAKPITSTSVPNRNPDKKVTTNNTKPAQENKNSNPTTTTTPNRNPDKNGGKPSGAASTGDVYKGCYISWIQEKKLLIGLGSDRKSVEVKLDSPVTGIDAADSACKTKLEAFKKDNKYFELHKYANSSQYETKDWQHKKVTQISVLYPLK